MGQGRRLWLFFPRVFESPVRGLLERLGAARELKTRGWRVRIRIDPMIKGYDYRPVAEQVRQLVPERVTLGTLGANEDLWRRTNHGLFAELLRPVDRNSLARYPKGDRLAGYRQAVQTLAGICPVGLCEETPDVWTDLGLSVQDAKCNCGL